jgi:Tol biopolymer transport system component
VWFVKFGPILNPPNPLVEADGITLRQVWAKPDADDMGSPSPDGRFLSFVDWDTGDLAVRDLDSEKNRRLTNKGAWSESDEFAMESVFSPDGSRIAYTWFTNQMYELRVVGLHDSSPHVLLKDLDYVWPAQWSPDGTQILATIWQKKGPAEIALISVDDGSLRILKGMDSHYPRKMSLSPDGRFIAFDLPAQPETLARDIFLLSTKTQEESALVRHTANDLCPVWTPDGTSVVFASDRTGAMGLWIQKVKDGNAMGATRLVKADIGRATPMHFTQGGKLYYGLETGMFDVYVTRLDLKKDKMLEEPTPVTQQFVGFNLMPDWSPNGKYLSYLSRRSPWHSNRDDGARIVIRNLATGHERGIAPNLKSCTAPTWSPDGRFFLVRGQNSKGSHGVFKIEVNTGETTELFMRRKGTLERNITWSRDGEAIFFRRYDEAQDTEFLIHRELDSGQEEELLQIDPPNYLRSLALSRDGRYLAFQLSNYITDIKALHTMPVTGGKSQELLKVESPEDLVSLNCLEWTPRDEEILFVKSAGAEAQGQNFELMGISPKGGQARSIVPMMENVRDLKMHPDGTSLVFTAGKREVEVWAMEDFLPERMASN